MGGLNPPYGENLGKLHLKHYLLLVALNAILLAYGKKRILDP